MNLNPFSWWTNKVDNIKLTRAQNDYLEVLGAKKKLELDIENKEGERSREKREHEMLIAEIEHKNKLSVASKEQEHKLLVEKLKSEHDVKLNEAISLNKLETQQKVAQAKIDHEKEVATLKEAHRKEMAEERKKLFDELSTELVRMNKEGNASTTFMSDLALKMLDKAPMANKQISETTVTEKNTIDITEATKKRA